MHSAVIVLIADCSDNVRKLMERLQKAFRQVGLKTQLQINLVLSENTYIDIIILVAFIRIYPGCTTGADIVDDF